MLPDLALLLVGGNMGVQVMTKEHISIACALQIPLAVVVTKVDIAPESVLKQTRQTLARYLRKNAKMPYPIKEVRRSRSIDPMPMTWRAPIHVHTHTHALTHRLLSRDNRPADAQMGQVEAAAASIASDRVTPVFAISSVTGQVGRH